MCAFDLRLAGAFALRVQTLCSAMQAKRNWKKETAGLMMFSGENAVSLIIYV